MPKQLTAKAVGQLINLRRFEGAYRAALRQASFHPHNVAAWQAVVLAALLTGRYTQALLAHELAQKCPDFTPIADGHMLRDFALYWLRCGKQGVAFMFVAKARAAHCDNANLIAGLKMTEARIYASLGELHTAHRLHTEASYELTDPQWVYNNKVAWLYVARRLGDRSLADVLTAAIAEECPQGAKNRSGEAKLLNLPAGPWLYTARQRSTNALRALTG